LNFKDIVITATLNNGKRIVIEPNPAQLKAQYRYMTKNEIDTNQIEVNKKHVWIETPLYSTVEEGVTFIFSRIEGTAVVVNRF
jgi:hypothetical protein